jgi:hypothetical protein
MKYGWYFPKKFRMFIFWGLYIENAYYMQLYKKDRYFLQTIRLQTFIFDLKSPIYVRRKKCLISKRRITKTKRITEKTRGRNKCP